MTVSKAQAKATAKYEKNNYDRILTRFPKGTKERLQNIGAESLNSFIVSATLKAIEREERKKQKPDPEV